MPILMAKECTGQTRRTAFGLKPLTAYAPIIAAAKGFAVLFCAINFASAAVAEPVRILAFGDSLTAGYGASAKDTYPAKLEAALKAKGYDVQVINAGVGGETASGGLARIDWTLKEKVDAVILELGANDMLRGVDPAVTKTALDGILAKLKAARLPVLIAGMLAAPNHGTAYRQTFDAIYPELAARYGALLYPFFLEGVAGSATLNLPDGLHPKPAGYEVIVNGILPKVEELVQQVQAARAAAAPAAQPAGAPANAAPAPAAR